MEGCESFFEGGHEGFVDESAGGGEEEMLLKWVGLGVPAVDGDVAVEAGYFVGVPVAVEEACTWSDIKIGTSCSRGLYLQLP